jgi:two-component system response regulator AtoC
MYATVAALAATTPTAALTMTAIEARYISELLEKHNGHRRTVAEILGISERTLYRKLKSYQLPPDKAE